jgi:Spy/CpxP family protein refolding chaperone
MKSVKKIMVTALTLCMVSAMGIAAQAARSDRADNEKRQPEMKAEQYAGDRHEREYGRTNERNHGDRDRYRHQKYEGQRDARRSPEFKMRVVIPAERRGPGYHNRRHGNGYMGTLNLTPRQSARIQQFKRAAKAEIAAVRSNPYLSFDAKKVRITSIRMALQNRIRSILSLEQKRQFDMQIGYGRR